MKLSRIIRLVELISLLQVARGQNADSLAAACGVSRRTVFRDLDILRQAGVPLEFDEERQRYHLNGGFLLPATNFSPQEALALLIVCNELGDGAGLPFHGPARTAAAKLESTLPARLRDYLRETSGAVRIRLEPNNRLAEHEEIYRHLLEATTARRAVRIAYDSLAEARPLQTRLDPYRLLFSRRSWYVIGRSSVHRGVRTFNVGRIRRLEPLAERFQVPRGFTVERYLGNAWHLVNERGPDRDVTIHFQKMVAQNVAEVAWHKTQRLEFQPDGSLLFHVRVSGLSEISWWVLGYGDQAKVIKPVALRELIVARCRRMLEQYQP